MQKNQQPENGAGKETFAIFGRIRNGKITIIRVPQGPKRQPATGAPNKPYSGQYTATVRDDRESLTGTGFKPKEKVFILIETLKKEADEYPGEWTIGIIKANHPESNPACIPLGRLNLPARTRREVNAAKKKLEQIN